MYEKMTGYMSEMRKLVGHRTIIQCSASTICVNEDNKVLLGRCSDNHLLGYSGGSVEIDEHAEDCAKRELLEEISPPIRNVMDSFVQKMGKSI